MRGFLRLCTVSLLLMSLIFSRFFLSPPQSEGEAFAAEQTVTPMHNHCPSWLWPFCRVPFTGK